LEEVILLVHDSIDTYFLVDKCLEESLVGLVFLLWLLWLLLLLLLLLLLWLLLLLLFELLEKIIPQAITDLIIKAAKEKENTQERITKNREKPVKIESSFARSNKQNVPRFLAKFG
jgi:hypothetical protein